MSVFFLSVTDWLTVVCTLSFVEYTCYLIETKVMIKNCEFKESDMILISSIRYHLCKLALCLLGELPVCALIRGAKKKTIMQRVFSWSTQFMPNFKQMTRQKSASVMGRPQRMAFKRDNSNSSSKSRRRSSSY